MLRLTQESQMDTKDDEAKVVERKPRGFQLMTPERRAEISRIGGVAAHKAGTAHEFTPQEAKAAGQKGGLASGKRRKVAA